MSDFRLKVFYMVANLASFSKAAEELYITQPAISFQIRSLEDELGCNLFIRKKNQIILTNAGKTFFKYSEKILRLYEEAEGKINQITKSIKGKIVIGVTSVIGSYYIPSVLDGFKRKYPHVEITLLISNTRNIIRSLKENITDVCIVSEPIYDDCFNCQNLFRDELVLMVPVGHKFVEKDSISLRELEKEPLILREEGSNTRELIKGYLKRKGKVFKDFNIIMAVGSSQAEKIAVEKGLGVAFIAKSAIQLELKLQSLKAVSVKNLDMFQTFVILSPKKIKKYIVTNFLNFMKKFDLIITH